MKQISIPITSLTARQIARLAQRWGLPEQRYNTAVIERAVTTVYMLEIGAQEYRQRLADMQQGVPSPPTWAEQLAALRPDQESV